MGLPERTLPPDKSSSMRPVWVFPSLQQILAPDRSVHRDESFQWVHVGVLTEVPTYVWRVWRWIELIRMYVCIHVLHTYIYVCTYVRMHACMHCMYLCMYVYRHSAWAAAITYVCAESYYYWRHRIFLVDFELKTTSSKRMPTRKFISNAGQTQIDWLDIRKIVRSVAISIARFFWKKRPSQRDECFEESTYTYFTNVRMHLCMNVCICFTFCEYETIHEYTYKANTNPSQEKTAKTHLTRFFTAIFRADLSCKHLQ
jgi:hypothetical protein